MIRGFIVALKRRKGLVADISFKDIADVFEIRAALEVSGALWKGLPTMSWMK